MIRHAPIKTKRKKPRRTGAPLLRVGKSDGLFRCPQWLKLAAKVPHCMRRACRATNIGQVVAAHSNLQSRGKGKGIKAHDIAPYLCNVCHDLVDGRTPGMTQDERERESDDALFETILWLMRERHLQVIP